MGHCSGELAIFWRAAIISIRVHSFFSCLLMGELALFANGKVILRTVAWDRSYFKRHRCLVTYRCTLIQKNLILLPSSRPTFSVCITWENICNISETVQYIHHFVIGGDLASCIQTVYTERQTFCHLYLPYLLVAVNQTAGSVVAWLHSSGNQTK